MSACCVFEIASRTNSIWCTKIPRVHFNFPEFSRINKFPKISRFSRVVSTLHKPTSGHQTSWTSHQRHSNADDMSRVVADLLRGMNVASAWQFWRPLKMREWTEMPRDSRWRRSHSTPLRLVDFTHTHTYTVSQNKFPPLNSLQLCQISTDF